MTTTDLARAAGMPSKRRRHVAAFETPADAIHCSLLSKHPLRVNRPAATPANLNERPRHDDIPPSSE